MNAAATGTADEREDERGVAAEALAAKAGAAARGAEASAPCFARVIEALPGAVCVTDASGIVTYGNRAMAAFAGREPALGRDRFFPAQRVLRRDGRPFTDRDNPIAAALDRGETVRGSEGLLEMPDGGRRPFSVSAAPFNDDHGRRLGCVALFDDISARRQVEQQLEEAARRDALTGLPNRLALADELARRVAKAAGAGERLLLMRCDIDRFKWLNDEFGTAVGDGILSEVAARLCRVLPHGFVARAGGDEFVAVVPLDGAESAPLRLAERISEVFRPHFEVAGRRFPVTLGVGCARYPQDGASDTLLASAANAALGLAKAGGPASVRLFDQRLQERERSRASLRQALRDAIQSRGIEVHYQPQFGADGVIVAFEALARWQHPELGLVPPSTFIPVAEEAGLIGALGQSVLEIACREAAAWTRPLRIAVNLSPIEFQSEDCVARVETVLRETGLDPERLELEITEGVMVTDAERAMATLARLRALGLRIALDDFGTGYSSLSYLHRFPLNTLKIDRSFIAKLGVTLESVAITRAIIQLGHALGIEVVAEGVETPEQLAFLIEEGCDLTQGFLLGAPGEAAAYGEVMRG